MLQIVAEFFCVGLRISYLRSQCLEDFVVIILLPLFYGSLEEMVKMIQFVPQERVPERFLETWRL